MPRQVCATKEEQRAINSLKRLAKKWPDTLRLFSWSGSLTVWKNADDGQPCVVDYVSGISNDGGDPSSDEVDQFADVFFD